MLDRDGLFGLLSPKEFIQALGSDHGWSRGLPTPSDLQVPEVANMFRHMLQNQFIKHAHSPHTLKYLHEQGWIFSTTNNNQIVYVFPSPLHRLYLEWKLLPSSGEVPFATLSKQPLPLFEAFNPPSCPTTIGELVILVLCDPRSCLPRRVLSLTLPCHQWLCSPLLGIFLSKRRPSGSN